MTTGWIPCVFGTATSLFPFRSTQPTGPQNPSIDTHDAVRNRTYRDCGKAWLETLSTEVHANSGGDVGTGTSYRS